MTKGLSKYIVYHTRSLTDIIYLSRVFLTVCDNF